MRPAERHGRREVINRLRGDARPIDRVDARQLQLVAEARVVEQRLHDSLAIVEGALERDDMHVGRVDAGHLAALHLRDAPVRVEDEHVDLIEALEGLDGGAAGIARGRADDRRAGAARAQDVVHQLPEQLHGHVLEGEGRAVEQLEHEQVVADLGEGAHGRMAEGGVGCLDHAAEIGGSNVVDESAEHGLGDVGVAPAREIGDRLARERRPSLGQIEAAVAREPGQHRVGEADRRRFAAGRDMKHDQPLLTRAGGVPQFLAETNARSIGNCFCIRASNRSET